MLLRWQTVLGITVLAVILLIAIGCFWFYQESRGPALAEGMRWERDCCNVNSPYDARLRQMFPEGSSERALREVLVRQGFELEGRRAVARWSDLACGYFADVEWEADETGLIIKVSGDYGSACV
jgi:hypothetical protein